MSVAQKNMLAGLSLILGGTYMAIWGAAHILPALLITVGILGLHSRQSIRAGTLGRIGLILLVADLVVGGGLELFAILFLNGVGSLNVSIYLLYGLVLAVGMLVYGIATMRAKVFQGGQLLVLGPLLIVVIGIWGARLAALGLVILGYFLQRSLNHSQVESTSPQMQ